MSSQSIFDGGDIYHCGMGKLIPGARMMTFAVNHHYPARHPNHNFPLWGVDENIRGGYFAQREPRIKNEYYDGATCWDDVLNAGIKEQWEGLQMQAQQEHGRTRGRRQRRRRMTTTVRSG
jgi:hypothetical protein